MSSKNIVDSRERSKICWLMDPNTIDVLTFEPEDINDFNLDSGYTFTLRKEGSSDVVYTVGSGINLDVPTKVIAITHDSTNTPGKWTGELKSDSNVVGTYLKVEVELSVE